MERFDRFYTKLCEVIAFYIVGALIGISMFYVTANVVGRYLFHSPTPGMTDYVGIMLVPITCLSLGYGWYKGAYVTVDILQNKLQGKVLWGFQFAFLLLCLIFLSGMIWYGAVVEVISSYTQGLLAGSPGYFSPQWPWRVTMALGFFLLVIRNILDLIRMVMTGEVIPMHR